MENINNETVQQILQGSKNIDRMREEVEFFVRMIIGLVDMGSWSRVRDAACRNIIFGSNDCDWIVWTDHHGRHPGAKCVLHTGDGITVSYMYYEAEKEPFSFWRIEETHTSLPVFLKGMIETFPEVEKRLQPFLDASKVQF